MPWNNVWEQRSLEQTSRFQQQQSTRTGKKESDDHNTATKPKSAPPLTTHNQPYVFKDKEQKLTTDKPIQPLISGENPSISENLPNSEIISTSTNVTMPKETVLPSVPSNPTSDDLFFRAIQDSEQIQNPLRQSSEPTSSIPFQSSNPMMYTQRTWGSTPSQYFQNPCMSFIVFRIMQVFFFL